MVIKWMKLLLLEEGLEEVFVFLQTEMTLGEGREFWGEMISEAETHEENPT